MQRDFQRVAIVNRGEAAMRFIHAAREFNQQHGTSLCSIALFTDPDRRAMFVREADEAVPLGAAQVIDPDTHQARSSYVDYACLEAALKRARADAVWVGWGFVAEHAAFADLCQRLGIVFIGPDGEVMRRLGDKISSKLLAEQAQVPVAPWSGGAVENIDAARHYAECLGYPLLIKATAGGGGHGIRCVHSSEELPVALDRARAEAFAAFGNPTVFMEKMICGARHVEVQIIADDYGTTWAVGVRDCTLQRRHQKVLEEAPSPALSAVQHQQLCDAAVCLAQAAGYRNAGTVEFLYDAQSRQFLFMEVNTRLQVEHPVTECTTGLDLVKLQLLVARGGRLEGSPPRSLGHAIEVRLNAEDPENGFAPAPGTVEKFRILAGPGVRVDTGVAEGDSVPPEFDSMIAKIIAFGQDRSEALSRLQRTLRESVVVVDGGASNKSFLLTLLNQPEVQRSEVDVGWLGRFTANSEHISGRYADVALIQAAIETYVCESAIERTQFYGSAVRGRPQVRSEVGRTVALRYRSQSYSLKVYRTGPHDYSVLAEGQPVEVRSERLGESEYWLTIGGRRFRVISVPQKLTYRIEVDGVAHRVDRDEGGVVHAPAPAVVVSIAVKPGDVVAEGDRLVVLEAMKMEMQVVAPFAGLVRQVMTIPYVQVETGDPLVGIEPADEMRASLAGKRVGFDLPQLERAASDHHSLEEIRRLLLGFDVDPAQVPALIRSATAGRPDTDTTERWPGSLCAQEDEILSAFVDICSLFQREPEMDDSGEAPSSEVHLFAYLRMLETKGEGLPASFVDALRRALAHYGISTLEKSPELEECLFRIYKSHQRMEQQIAPVMGLLERRLRLADTGEQFEPSFRLLLDRMVTITRDLFPSVSDLAREVRYRCFDQPLFEQARKQVYAQVDEHLAVLAANPQSPERDRGMRAMVECPQPLVSLFAPRFANAGDALRRLMLEVLTLRYYRIRALENVRSLRLDGHCYTTAEYDYQGKRIHVFTTPAEYGQLSETASAVAALLSGVPADHDIVVDFYLWHSGPIGEPERIQQEVRSVLSQCGFPRPLRRIVVAIASPGRGQGMAGMLHFTYRPDGTSYEEEKLYRGMHPMMAKRLHLWQLGNFNVDRLPSVEDVYLFRGVARENPKDERLFAFAEVRDATPVRDEHGRIVQLPHLERMLSEALAAMRVFQSRRTAQERLYWNRILLYVWPSLRLRRDELRGIIHRLAAAIEGMGLQEVVVRARIPQENDEGREVEVHISNPAGTGLRMSFRPADELQLLEPLTEYDQKVVRMRQRGFVYPYEIVRMLTPAISEPGEFPPGDFVEHDLDAEGHLVPVDRPYGKNKANIIVGVIRNFTDRYPEGMRRVLVLGDPSKDLGAIAEPECRRILAALDLAQKSGMPLEWFPISAGAKISMESGVENMDWIAHVLRRLVEFTQAGGEVNLVVNGINVGAQPYWNAEATMLMHTRGILIMTPKAAMVLTGKRALEFSGSVSAEDNQGIGGYDRIMGMNGQAQYWTRDIDDACHVLLRHYEHTYVAPGERFPRPAISTDPRDRDVCAYPHSKGKDDSFVRVGEIFSDESNAGRKKSFDIRRVMMAVVDQDYVPLERWPGMRAAETAVVWDAHLGGNPVCLIGIESRPLPRFGFVPADGPDQWTAGTLFPLSSKKVARAINAASNNRPLVLLANLSGFDGSPESMRRLQLEYGAEIGRAVVNFKGPLVFCVISRYHGGAYVVFSRVLNEGLEVAALEGTYASVIGGAPAAAVVFASEVQARTRKDARLQALTEALSHADGAEKARLRAQWEELFKVVHCEKLGEMADEFDRIHSVQRALKVGALHRIIPAARLRPYLIDAVERGIAKTAGSELLSCEHTSDTLRVA